MIPQAAVALLPLLWVAAADVLPQVPRHYFAGQIDLESGCPAKSCWSPHAELKTSRERGIGLGQVTVAYRSDGSVRFDNLAEARRKYPELRDWTWEKRYDPKYQIRGLVRMDADCYRVVPFAKDGLNRAAMMLVCYNSGLNGILQDRQLCRETAHCDPDRWFDNVEKQSLKSHLKTTGYGRSFFEISRAYPRDIMFVRSLRYRGA